MLHLDVISLQHSLPGKELTDRFIPRQHYHVGFMIFCSALMMWVYIIEQRHMIVTSLCLPQHDGFHAGINVLDA